MRVLSGAVLEPPEMRAQRAAPLQIRILQLGLPDGHYFRNEYSLSSPSFSISRSGVDRTRRLWKTGRSTGRCFAVLACDSVEFLQ